ncbi:2-phospho-L-lactate guanylyltransferase [Mesorhizobium sp. A556]
MRYEGYWALIPLKAAAEAKTRLAGLLDAGQRASLQQAMLEDLLEGLADSRLLSGLAIYGPEPVRGPCATNPDLVHLRQPADARDLNAAVTDGVCRLVRGGAGVIAVLPGDLPLIEGEELDHALSDVAARGHCAIIPDRWREGTNGIVFPAAAQLRFGFGLQSFQRHLGDGGEGTAWPREALDLASFAGDIDTAEDLTAFCLDQRGLRGRHTRAVIDAITPAPAATPVVEEIGL